jgi:hypothetical protein
MSYDFYKSEYLFTNFPNDPNKTNVNIDAIVDVLKKFGSGKIELDYPRRVEEIIIGDVITYDNQYASVCCRVVFDYDEYDTQDFCFEYNVPEAIENIIKAGLSEDSKYIDRTTLRTYRHWGIEPAVISQCYVDKHGTRTNQYEWTEEKGVRKGEKQYHYEFDSCQAVDWMINKFDIRSDRHLTREELDEIECNPDCAQELYPDLSINIWEIQEYDNTDTLLDDHQSVIWIARPD